MNSISENRKKWAPYIPVSVYIYPDTPSESLEEHPEIVNECLAYGSYSILNKYNSMWYPCAHYKLLSEIADNMADDGLLDVFNDCQPDISDELELLDVSTPEENLLNAAPPFAMCYTTDMYFDMTNPVDVKGLKRLLGIENDWKHRRIIKQMVESGASGDVKLFFVTRLEKMLDDQFIMGDASAALFSGSFVVGLCNSYTRINEYWVMPLNVSLALERENLSLATESQIAEMPRIPHTTPILQEYWSDDTRMVDTYC